LEVAVAISQEREPIADLLVARGKLPSHALESRIKLHIDWDWSKALLVEPLIVEEGQLVLEILPEKATPEDGEDLMGRVLPAKSGVAFDFSIGSNLRKVQTDDGLIQCFAEKKGEIEINSRGVSVVSVREIEGNVSLRTGSIKFSGEVNVHGSVESGYYIMAGSTVKIGEMVHKALVSSDADIQIKQGVSGQGKGLLRARKSILVGYCENAHLMSVGDLVVKQSAMDCQIKCNGRIHLGKEQGRLVGGETKAKYGLSVYDLGDKKSTETKVSFGQDYLVLDQIEVEEREIEKLRRTVEKIDELMKKAEVASQRDKISVLRNKKVKAFRFIEKRSMRIFNLRERYEEHFQGEIRVYGTLYPGVLIESHGRSHEVEKEYNNVSVIFNLNNGKLEINKIENINKPA